MCRPSMSIVRRSSPALPVLVAVISVALGAAPRVALAAGLLPAPLRPFVWSDVLHIWERGVRDGALPYWNAFFEYPPLVGYVWAAIESVAPSAATLVLAWALLQAAAAGLVAFVLARESGRARTLAFWSLSPQLLIYGSLNFDVFAVAALVVAVALARRGRLMNSALALAVGTAAKLFPAAALPLVLAPRVRARERRAVTASAIFVLVTAAAFAPGALAPYATVTSLTRYSVGLAPNLDSVWGLLRASILATGRDPLEWIVALSLAGMAVTYVALVLPLAARSADPSRPVAVGVLTLLLWTPLYSPQYSLWVLPFFALAGLPLRAFIMLAVADVAVFLSVYPLTVVPPTAGEPAPLGLTVLLAAGLALREAALVIAAREAARAAPPHFRPRCAAEPTG
ncbi:MAG: DUF2029 domain-containing protein [Chloroflexota bacterium]|nr:DUF2029 domain-containing protein [Chloroflexota bacterium]